MVRVFGWRLVAGLAFLSLIFTSTATRAFPVFDRDRPSGLPFSVGLEIERGSIADRGAQLERMLVPLPRIERLVAPVEGLSKQRQLAYVQSVIGELVAWRSDDQLWGQADRWAAPRETLARRAGDCEDIAILKLAALASLGFSPDRLALVVGTDRVRGDHAIAAAWADGRWNLLDDDGLVRSAASMKRFDAIYSLVGGRAYLHGRARPVRPAGD